jgi:hypothetical protein
LHTTASYSNGGPCCSECISPQGNAISVGLPPTLSVVSTTNSSHRNHLEIGIDDYLLRPACLQGYGPVFSTPPHIRHCWHHVDCHTPRIAREIYAHRRKLNYMYSSSCLDVLEGMRERACVHQGSIKQLHSCWRRGRCIDAQRVVVERPTS